MILLKKCISSLLWGALFMGVFMFSAHADQGGRQGPAAFSDFDVDKNGQISEQEFNTLRAERMAANAAAGRKMHGAASAPSFADVDVDGNGYIDSEELISAQQTHMAKRQQMGKGQGKGHGCSGDSKKNCTGMKGQMPAFADFDLDGNGIIDESEFNQAHAERMSTMASAGHQMKHAADAPGFAGIDTNVDGVISEDEFAAHQADHHKKSSMSDSHGK